MPQIFRVSPLLLAASLAFACSNTDHPAMSDAGGQHSNEDAHGSMGDRDAAVDASSTQDAGSTPDAFAPDAAAPIDDTPIDDRFRPIADAFDAERRMFGAPGAALLILEHGQVTFAHGFGSKSPMMMDPVHATTLFRIGSVTKAMTATALLELVAENKVDLDAPLSTAISGFAFAHDATWAPSIKVRDLLRHATGIVDYIDVACSHDDAYLDTYMNGYFSQMAYLMAPAGRMYNYSNPNFSLAGLVIERASGQKYRMAVQQRVFAPLHMDRSYFLGEEAVADGDYADALTTTDTGTSTTVTPTSYDCAWTRPAGYAMMSVRDLAKFVLFLAKGDDSVLSSMLRGAMTSSQIDTHELGDLIHYGFGVSVYDGVFLGQNDFRRTKILTHGGAINGYSAEWYYYPETDFGIVTMANTDGAYFTNTLVMSTLSLANLPAASAPPDLTVDPMTFPKYAGTYVDDFNVGQVLITNTATSISVRMPNVDRANVPYDKNLEPISPDNFLLTIQGQQVQVTFILDAQGNGEFFRARPFVAHRTANLRGLSHHSVDRERLIRALKAARLSSEAREARYFRAVRTQP